MRRSTLLLLWLAAGAISSVPAVAAAQGQSRERNERDNRRDGDRVCFYKDIGFTGGEWCYRPGDELADLRDRRNEFSSIRIIGRARVVVYDEREFGGAADEFTSDVSDLTLRNLSGSRSWNDRIESFQVESDLDRPGRRGPRGRGDVDEDRDNRFGRNGICVYEEPDFRGRSECFESGDAVRNLSRTNGWNDRISSIRVFGRARVEVYRDADYHGERMRIDRDVANLSAMRWDDQISSFEVR